MIDRITDYAVVAERCSAHLHSLNLPNIEQLWAQVQTDFLADPVKYPSVMAEINDLEGRQKFQLKCQEICFPPNSEVPRNPADSIPIIFAAQAGLQSLQSQDLFMHPYRGEIHYRANLRVLKEIGGQASYDAAIEFERKARDKPSYLVSETIECRDKTSGCVRKYTVIDYGTSVLKGDYFVLQDYEGLEKEITVTVRELSEMRV